ncbi:MAG: HupE/UreJ family protein, partial [Myxococcota bacterium]
MISRATCPFLVAGSLAMLWVAEPVAAHRLAPVLWELREGPEGRVEMRWKTTLVQPTGSALRPTLPEPCESLEAPVVARDSSSATARWSAACGPRGLVGQTLGVEGLPGSGTDVVLRIELADGRRLQAVLSGDTGTYRIPESHGHLAMLADYAALGVRHILTGLDHLLFVLGLLLLVRRRR